MDEYLDEVCVLCGDDGEVYQTVDGPDDMILVPCECTIEGTEAYEKKLLRN